MIIDGLVLGGIFAGLALGSLWLDARIWIQDYPPDIQVAAAAAGQAPLPLRLAVAVALIGSLLSGVIYSNWLVARKHDRTPRFRSVFVHTFGLFWIVNLVDVLIVDWLVFVTIQPEWVVLPGTAGLPGYDDYSFHLEASVLSVEPWLISLILAGVMGLVLPRFWTRRMGAS